MTASLTPTGYRALSVVEILERTASGNAEERREFVHLSSNAARSPSSAEISDFRLRRASIRWLFGQGLQAKSRYEFRRFFSKLIELCLSSPDGV